MSILWNVLTPLANLLPPLAEQVPAPEDLKAGWVAFGIFLALAAAVVFLAFSLRKHLKKVNFEEDADSSSNADPNGSV